MPENGTSGSMSGDGKRSGAEWPKLPRPSSTLPRRTSLAGSPPRPVLGVMHLDRYLTILLTRAWNTLAIMKVLVVDDHVLIREALRGVLKELGSDVAISDASSGRQAMQLVEEHGDLSLILLNLNLPDRDGFGLLSELRARYP